MDIAIVSDAGTPGVSDPGQKLIGEAIRRGSVCPAGGARCWRHSQPRIYAQSLFLQGLGRLSRPTENSGSSVSCQRQTR